MLMTFKAFAKAIVKQIDLMTSGQLFETAVPGDELWALYLSSFPEGSNPIYKERTEHDCNCCKNFIRDVGRMISIRNGEAMSVWDVRIGGAYQVVVDALAKRVRESQIENVYTHWSEKVGTEKNLQQLTDGSVKQWEHFHGVVPKECVSISPTVLSEVASTVAVFKRGLEEITDNAIDVTLELIDQNSLYRGAEFKAGIVAFRYLKLKYADAKRKDYFLWSNYKDHGARIRNTAIGTLLQDLSGDVELDHAVKSFEAKVAPTNYKRPAALITKAMIETAMKAIRVDGLEDSLYRRFAVIEDLSVNDILFADRGVKPAMRDSLSDALMGEVKERPKDFSKTKEMHISEFLTSVLPNVSSIEVCLENQHEPNLVSLIGPKLANAASLFKWNNQFSWSYNGNVTDSIKERVKAAGGKVDGYMRVSLSWFNFDDLDLHVHEPGGFQIFYGNKYSTSKGHLDVDMNAGRGTSRSAVENVAWPEQRSMPKGEYVVRVHNFAKRETTDFGFEVEIECANELYKFSYARPVPDKQFIELARIKFDGKSITDVRKVEEHATMGSVSRTIWGLDTNKFHKVSLLTLSPNHWHGSEDGNKHYIFVLEGCSNPDKARGFYNEFLPAKYNQYRKVFEVLGDKTKCEHSERQLSGLGFSSTKENSVVCKVSGNINRMLKITF